MQFSFMWKHASVILIYVIYITILNLLCLFVILEYFLINVVIGIYAI